MYDTHMHMIRFSFTTLTLLGLVAVGCSGSSSSPTSPSSASGSLSLTAGQIAGRWSLTSLQPTGQAAQARPSGATYDLTFAGGRVSTRADCNVCNAPVSMSGQMLTIGGPHLACTLAACPTMAFENTYTSILAGDSSANVSGSMLTLSSTRGVLRFTR